MPERTEGEVLIKWRLYTSFTFYPYNGLLVSSFNVLIKGLTEFMERNRRLQ